ncbi:MAG: hypothetical protein JWL77_1905 [Chthonomonadaceae bacterium]|nr:hypothetical protein [Chthonomonadaceae bacterium]
MTEDSSPSEAVPQEAPSGFDTEFRFDPRLRRLAKLSYRLACAGPFAFWVMALLYPPTNERALPSLPIQALWWILCLSAPCGVALGAVALFLFRRQSLGHRKLNVSYARAGLIVGILASLSLLVEIPNLNSIRRENHYGGDRRTSCLSNVKQLGLGFMMYAQDYDEHYPLPRSWNEGVYPYIKNWAVFHCPYVEEENLPTYAMNRRLKSVLLARIETPQNTVLLFDSIPGKNLSGGRELLPDPPRHGTGDYYSIGFTDGHAKGVALKDLSGLLWTPHLTTIPFAPDTQHDSPASNPAPTGK